jgi:sugar phosphate isomerase/epimerase
MIALSTGSLHTYGTARVARLAADAGFDGLELMISESWDTRDPAYLLEIVRNIPIPILSVHAPFRQSIPGWGDDEVTRLGRSVEIALAVGARTVVIHPPLRYYWLSLRYAPFVNIALLTPIRRATPRATRYRRWLQTELVGYTQRAGVNIAIETMPRHRLGPRLVNLFDMNEIRDLRRLSALTLDTAHIATWGVNLLETYDVLADRVTHVHLSNYARGRQHRLPHDGSLALGPFLAALRKRGFDGVIAVELEPDSAGAGDDRRVHERLVQSLVFCRQHFS